MSTPTQRSLKLLRDEGYIADVVERWLPRANVRKDLFGCIDIVAIHPIRLETVGVQTTSASNLAARQRKAHKMGEIKVWLQCGNKFILHGWVKRKNRWTAIVRHLEA